MTTAPLFGLRFACPTLFALLLFSPCSFSADESPIAAIGKQPVSMQELDARTSGKLSELQKKYDKSLRELNVSFTRERNAYIERELNALLDERVLGLEADLKKTTPDALRAAVKVPQVTDTQIKAFFESNKSQMDQPFDKIAPMIKDYLLKQSAERSQRTYLNALRAKYKVAVSMQPLRETVEAMGPQRGPDDAAVTIVEFSDFQCPFCGRFSPVLKEILAKYPTQVRLIYRHLPLVSLHPNALGAAEAAVCARKQGKFWEMHDLLFAEQSTLGVDGVKEKAKRIGLDSKAFDDCLANATTRETVQNDVAAAEQLGIGGTPFSFVNGRFVNGASSADDISAIIDDELRRAGKVAR